MSQWMQSLLGEQWMESLRATRSVTLMLWGGLALLTVTLFVLMRTRWGQAKPLSKCIALSVMAHVLFAAYAYGTRLFFDVPPGPKHEVVHLTVLDAAAVDQVDPGDEDRAPWNELAEMSQDTGVEMPVANRAATSVGEVASEDAPKIPAKSETPEFAIGVEPTGVKRDLPVEGVGEQPREPMTQPIEATVHDSMVRALPIEMPKPEAPTPDETPLPAPELMKAPDRAVVSVEPAAEEPGLTSESVERPQVEASMQQLAEAAIETHRAEARSAALDRLKSNGMDAVNTPSQPASAPVAIRRAPTWAPALAAGLDDQNAPRRLGDGQPLPPAYRARIPDMRLTIAKQFGGNEDTEAAVDAALKWLVTQQLKSGKWSARQHGAGRETKVLGHDRQGAGSNADTGITGLALLSLLAAGHTHYEGEYRQHVQHGLEYLLSVQRSDGCMAGDAKLFAQMYCHGMATLAVSEAFAMTGDQRLKVYVERAVRYSLSAQDPYSGGWRYQVGDRGGDMSQFGWQVMALKSAQLAGVTIPATARSGMDRFLGRCQKGKHRGLAGYRPYDAPSPTMTAEALTCSYFLEVKPGFLQRREAADYLVQRKPGSAAKANYYYWYYGTLAMFQHQGEPWTQWNQSLTRELLRRQESTGPHQGSWPPDSMWGDYGGRVFTTAMATLCLEVYYRYLPLYEQHVIATQPGGSRR